MALLFDLAPGGVYQAGAVTRAAGELLPHRFTLTALTTRESVRTAVCFLWHWSVGFPPLGVTQHPALRSPDFPPAALPRPATVWPSLAHGRVYRLFPRALRRSAYSGLTAHARTTALRASLSTRSFSGSPL